MREILARVSTEELATIAGDLERKSAAFRSILGAGARTLDRDELRQLLRWIFSVRRKADGVLDEIGPEALAAGIDDLLFGSDGLPARFDRFDELLVAYPEPGFDLPGELLHFTFPDRYWLWTRWMWDPRIETGALPLVATDEVNLSGATRGETYLAVGQAVAFIDQTGKAAGFTAMGPGLFGMDVFLGAVYAVYMYTVLRMRMTQEFNRIVPELPGLVRRLLGVYHLEG